MLCPGIDKCAMQRVACSIGRRFVSKRLDADDIVRVGPVGGKAWRRCVPDAVKELRHVADDGAVAVQVIAIIGVRLVRRASHFGQATGDQDRAIYAHTHAEALPALRADQAAKGCGCGKADFAPA